MIKAFFFDLDGTLVETHQANFHAYRRALADFGIEIGFEEFKQYIGESYQDFIPRLAPALSPDAYDELATKKATYYKEYLRLSQLNEQLVKFLRHMGQNHQIVLVTTAKRVNVESVLVHHGLEDAFDHVITAQEVRASKPDPEGYLLALQKTGLKPGEALVFEDSDVGQQAAEAAGIAVVRINDFAV